jgi:hypothetical protein
LRRGLAAAAAVVVVAAVRGTLPVAQGAREEQAVLVLRAAS